MSPAQSSPAKPKRRWRPQFSLRTMLLATLVFALLLGWLGEKIEVAWKQQRAAQAILSLGGRVYYEYQLLPSNPFAEQPFPPPGPGWLRWLLGEHFFARAAVVVYPPGAAADDLKLLDDLPYLTEINLHCANVTGAGLNHVWKHELKIDIFSFNQLKYFPAFSAPGIMIKNIFTHSVNPFF